MLTALHALSDRVHRDRAGTRLHDAPALTALLTPGSVLARVASESLGADARAVRAILFDKTARDNWSLGWHQDRVIVVRERIDTPGFAQWSVKQGMIHVAPPPALQARMLTMRVHLDPVPADNAPLLIVPGSHRLGRIAEHRIAGIVQAHGEYACLADPGDIWLYRTPIVHASAASAARGRRRVLQIDFAACDLPGGLRWLGV